jgi:serine/threonine protein phosphatase 1
MSALDRNTIRTMNKGYPPGPEGLTAYVVGDIHGRLDLLVGVQQRIDEDKSKLHPERTVEVYLGDYIDRGPDAAGVIEQLIGRSRHLHAVFLRGNHEQLFLDFLDGGDSLPQWQAVGGTSTMLSYGIAPSVLLRQATADVIRRRVLEKLPLDHLEFLRRTTSHFALGPYLAVHAGIKPGVKLADQRMVDLLSIRGDFLQYDGDLGVIVVHGHTPVTAPDLRHNRINIDTGAFATNRLTCLRIGEDGARVLDH